MSEFFSYVSGFIDLLWLSIKTVYNVSLTAFNVVSGSFPFLFSLQAILPTLLGSAVFIFLSLYFIKFIRSFL